MIASRRQERVLLVLPLALALSLSFAGLEFGVLLLISFSVVKLHCYRFANYLLKLMPFGR